MLLGRGSERTFDGSSAVIIEGDTVSIVGERIRILNIDAPESSHRHCERERVAGLKAKERLEQLVRSSPVSLDRQGEHRYRRTLARRTVSARDVEAVLIEERLALPCRTELPRSRPARHWCG